MAIAVVKVGGSLFDLPDLGRRLTAWLSSRRSETIVLFPGGGATADVVRVWHERFSLDEETSHQLAIRSLALNAELLYCLLPASRLIRSRADVDESPSAHGIAQILVPEDELTRLERQFPETAPPHLWDVTSDSLAAWVAVRWSAERLVLMKSAELPREIGALEAVRCGLVDCYFAGLAGEIPIVEWCRLRHTVPCSAIWLRSGVPAGYEPE